MFNRTNMKIFSKLLWVRMLVALSLIYSCTSEETQLSSSDQRLFDYFNEIAFGFELGGASQIIRRWEGDIKIFYSGQISENHIFELEGIIDELNQLIRPTASIQVVTSLEQSNFHIFFGSAGSYADLYPIASTVGASNFGLFFITWNEASCITEGHMYVDIIRTSEVEQMHLLREEFTQSLGLGRDSNIYPESIFFSGRTKSNSYAEIDKSIIKILYHPLLEKGQSRSEAKNILKEIIIDI